MADNPYTRSVTIEITELVPVRDQLPRCVGWCSDASQCGNKAKYTQEGQPVCGVHLGRPGLLFMPPRHRR